MKKIITLTLLLVCAFSSTIAYARSDESKALASFVYGLPKVVGDKRGELCVYGYDQVTVEIKEQYKNVVFFKNDENISISLLNANNCKVLYISRNKYSAIRYANEAKIISISIEDNFIEKGGMMIVQMGRRSFELTINHRTIKELKIKLDPLIEGLVIN